MFMKPYQEVLCAFFLLLLLIQFNAIVLGSLDAERLVL